MDLDGLERMSTDLNGFRRIRRIWIHVDEFLWISTDVVGFCRIGPNLYGSEWVWLDSNSFRQLLTDLNGYGSMGFGGCEWISTDSNIMDLNGFQWMWTDREAS